MCGNALQPFDALMVQDQRVPMRLRELAIGPHQGEREASSPIGRRHG
jgi:hypothetical protein